MLFFLSFRSLLLVLICGFGLSAGGPSTVFGQVTQARAWLGIAIDQGKTGVLIKQVLKETPAETAGFQAGDEVTSVDGKAVKDPNALIQTIQSKGIGHTVAIEFLRDGKLQKKSIQLVQKPGELDLVKKKLLNNSAPEFELQSMTSGKSGKLSEYKGKVVILEFWATWCPACIGTHKTLSAFAETHKDQIEILAVSDEEEKTLQAYMQQTKVKFTVLRDEKRVTHSDWFVSAIPMLGIIDKTGTVRHISIGGGSYLDEALAEAVKLL